MEFNSIAERNKFIESNLPLVADRVRQRNKGVFDEDLFQEGIKALIEATNRFDKNRGNKFSTYAVRYIDGYILMYKSRDSLIKPIRRRSADGYFQYKSISSLDIQIGEGRTTIYDIACKCDSFEQNVIEDCFVSDFLKGLNPKERKIINLRMNEITQKKISEFMGISQPQVHRIIKKVGERYRRYQLTCMCK